MCKENKNKKKYVDKNFHIWNCITVIKNIFVLLKSFFENFFFLTSIKLKEKFHRDQVILFRKKKSIPFTHNDLNKGIK